jgi:RNA polymerase sigma factor (sigma-70 family)
LLRRFIADGSHEAFAALVERHLPMVYGAARRQLGAESDQAEDVAQAVFILLARRAGTISADVSLPGWLYNATRLTAANVRRAAERRRRFERKAGDAMRERLRDDESSPNELRWSDIEPELDAALARLGSRDREVIVLRFLSGLSLRAVGDAVGMSEDAARVRVARSLTKLRRLMGVTAPVASLAVALETAHTSVPATELAARIATAALNPQTASVAIGGATAVTVGATTKVAAAAVLVLGIGVAAVAIPASRPSAAPVVTTTAPASQPTTTRVIGDSPRGVVIAILTAAVRNDRETIRALCRVQSDDDRRAADVATELFMAEARFDAALLARFPRHPDRARTRLNAKLNDITLARDDVQGDVGSIVFARDARPLAGFVKVGPQWKLVPSVAILEGGPPEVFEDRVRQAQTVTRALDELAALVDAGHYATREDALLELDRQFRAVTQPATQRATR